MAGDSLTRSPASVRVLVEWGVAQGLSAAALLRDSGVSVADLDDATAEISSDQELRVVSNLLRITKYPPGLGLQIGPLYHFSTYGVWGFGLISCATGADAIKRALEYIDLTFAFSAIGYHEDGAYGILTFDGPELESRISQFLVERDMVAAAALIREIIGHDFSLVRSMIRSDYRVRSDEHINSFTILNTKPDERCRVNALVIDKSVLERPLPQANPITASMCERMCRDLLESRTTKRSVSARVSHLIEKASRIDRVVLRDVSSCLNKSVRTLRRRLEKEGTSFRQIVSKSKCAKAEELLLDENLTVAEIADKLGFSDTSSFSQAFKRWHGVSPTAYRNKAKCSLI